jgi:hypothetical protein
VLEHIEHVEEASAREMKKELARLSGPVLAVVESARIDPEQRLCMLLTWHLAVARRVPWVGCRAASKPRARS